MVMSNPSFDRKTPHTEITLKPFFLQGNAVTIILVGTFELACVYDETKLSFS